ASVSPPPGAPPGGPAESTPRASPLTTLKPRAATSAARRPATSSAYGDAAREPTIATAGGSKAGPGPRGQRRRISRLAPNEGCQPPSRCLSERGLGIFQNLFLLLKLVRPPRFRELFENDGRAVPGAKLGSSVSPPVDWQKRQGHVVDAFFHERLPGGWSAQKRG